MENRGKTIKQIADELGVSKQAVHQKRKSKALSTALQSFTTTVDGVIYISVDGETLLKQAFSANEHKQVDGSFTTTIDGSFTPQSPLYEILKIELEAKNKQIEDLNARLAEAQQLIAQEQQLHAGTIQQQLTDGEHLTREEPQDVPATAPEQTKKLWKWWK